MCLYSQVPASISGIEICTRTAEAVRIEGGSWQLKNVKVSAGLSADRAVMDVRAGILAWQCRQKRRADAHDGGVAGALRGGWL